MMIGVQTIEKQKLKLPTDSQAINRMAALVEVLRRLDFDRGQFDVKQNASGMHVSIKPTVVSASMDGTFLCTLDGDTVTVKAGTFRLHGIGNYAVPETEVTLAGTPCWVFAWHMRDHSASGVDVMAAEPTSDTYTMRVPLCEYTWTAGVWSQEGPPLHIFDISIDSPIR